MGLADYVADDLVDLTERLSQRGAEPAMGLLGGEFGYGAEYENDVFEMHPFWWGDCQCGHEDREMEWENTHPHAESCYQSELRRRGYLNHPGYPDYDPNLPEGDSDLPQRLAAEWGLSRYGCAVHCTCGRDKQYAAWEKENPHPAHCPEVRPNFRHKASGAEVRWYKWIGRDTEVKGVGSRSHWRRIIAECEASL